MAPGGIGWVPHRERHRGGRSGWLRAAVLGADDGIVSIASLLVGVAAANVDLAKETEELATSPDAELDELTQIYLDRGLPAPTARQVAVELTARDALAAHARNELGLTETLRARPIQAATYSAASFVAGALLPMVAVLLAPAGIRIQSSPLWP